MIPIHRHHDVSNPNCWNHPSVYDARALIIVTGERLVEIN